MYSVYNARTGLVAGDRRPPDRLNSKLHPIDSNLTNFPVSQMQRKVGQLPGQTFWSICWWVLISADLHTSLHFAIHNNWLQTRTLTLLVHQTLTQYGMSFSYHEFADRKCWMRNSTTT